MESSAESAEAAMDFLRPMIQGSGMPVPLRKQGEISGVIG